MILFASSSNTADKICALSLWICDGFRWRRSYRFNWQSSPPLFETRDKIEIDRAFEWACSEWHRILLAHLPADYSGIFRARITRVHNAGVADQFLDSSADPQVPGAHRFVRTARVQFAAVRRVVHVRYRALMAGQNRVVLAVLVHVPQDCNAKRIIS